MDSEIKNSENFLKSHIKNETGFKIPDAYFNSFENQFSTFLSEEHFPKKTPFTTPKEYFNHLENSVLIKTLPKKQKVVLFSNTNKTYFNHKIKTIIAIAAAASIALILGLNLFFFTNTKTISIDDVASNELESWLYNNVNLISRYDLAFVYNDESVNEASIIPNSISDAQIENYLYNQENISLILEND